jgi:ubiquinone/menaquinone biosynthesis C-methylase UbiE
VFKNRSLELERIDTGDHTQKEYETFLREIRFINRYLGDVRALRRSLFREIEIIGLLEFSVLDVACGSGELLRQTAKFAALTGRETLLTGIDLHESSFTDRASDISFVRGDAFQLPFADDSFDFAISSLFFHHLPDERIPLALAEMSRVARRGVFVIDLERRRVAYHLYKLFCFAFRISPLVTHDGSLSVRKGFTVAELGKLGEVARSFPYRLIVTLKRQVSGKPR